MTKNVTTVKIDAMDIVSQVKKAIELTQEKDFNSAGKIYLELLKQDKDNPTILSLLGLLYLNIGKLYLAKKTLLKANKLNPNNKTIIEALGFTMFNLKDLDKACNYFEEIIDTTSNYEVFHKYVTALIEFRSYAKAYKYASLGHKKFPLDKDILSDLIFCEIFTGELNDATKHAQQLLTLDPKSSSSWLRQGLIYEVIFHDDESALECYHKAAKFDEKYTAYYNLAICYNKLNNPQKALYYLKKIIKDTGLTSSTSFLISTIYFSCRKIKKGFKYYSIKEDFKDKYDPVKRLKNVWRGEKEKGESLYVYCDQGIGDCIMFSRYFPFLEKKFKNIIIGLNPSLLKLFKRSFAKYKNLKFIKRKKSNRKSDNTAIMSNLPVTLKMETDFPFPEGYLKANEKLVKEYKTKYFNTDKLKVGICWEAGAAGIREQLNRTLHLSLFEDILNMENIQFYSFQNKPMFDDYKNYKNVIDIGTGFTNFDDTAAAMKNVDVMITVDTSVAHLAGALGVKTFMLLPYCTDWRWFDDTETTPWYDSITLFKQIDHVFWDKEISDIKYELEKML